MYSRRRIDKWDLVERIAERRSLRKRRPKVIQANHVVSERVNGLLAIRLRRINRIVLCARRRCFPWPRIRVIADDGVVSPGGGVGDRRTLGAVLAACAADRPCRTARDRFPGEVPEVIAR